MQSIQEMISKGLSIELPVVQNGVYTIENTATGEHRTFKIKTQSNDATFAPGERVISLLTGPNNESDYKGFGFVDNNDIRIWRSRRAASPHYEQYAKALWSLATLGAESPYSRKGYRLHLEGRCVMCNRRLTTPESIQYGIGPVCAEKSMMI